MIPEVPLRTQVERQALHSGHFAFMRAVLQGLDVRHSWDRYLRAEGTYTSARRAEHTIRWIRDAFAAAAKRHGRPGIARLVILQLSPLNRAGHTLPTLAEFVHAHNLENFSEIEQIQLYQQHYAVSSRAHARHARHARLVARQLEALNWLQQTIAQLPQPEDPIANWIHPDLAAHLAKSGLNRLADLLTRMKRFGTRWWRGIDAIGAKKAHRIEEWLVMHPTLLQAPSGSMVNVPPLDAHRTAKHAYERSSVAAQPEFTPLDRLTLPPGVSQYGPLRATPSTCCIAAADDLIAIRAWLGAKGRPPLAPGDLTDWDRLRPLSHTQRAYWKEAERFILWLLLERKIGLSSVSTQDCALYLDFLAAPAAAWCGPRGRGKWHPQWRPFEGPSSPAACRLAVTVVRSLFRYLVNQRYLSSNPWAAQARPPTDDGVILQRRFNEQAWTVIDRTLAGLPATSVNQRLALAIGLIGATGLRVGQVVRARVSDLCLDSDRARWHLRLDEPDRVVRCLPIPQPLAEALCAHLRERGLEADPRATTNRSAYLLGIAADVSLRAPWVPCARVPLDRLAGIGAGTLRDQIKHFFQQCSKQTVAGDPALAVQFSAASSEWLRGGRTAIP